MQNTAVKSSKFFLMFKVKNIGRSADCLDYIIELIIMERKMCLLVFWFWIMKSFKIDSTTNRIWHAVFSANWGQLVKKYFSLKMLKMSSLSSLFFICSSLSVSQRGHALSTCGELRCRATGLSLPPFHWINRVLLLYTDKAVYFP